MTDSRTIVDEARQAVSANPNDGAAHRRLSAALRVAGETDAANQAAMDAIMASEHDPELQRAGSAMLANDLRAAEELLRPLVKRRPDDAAALRMLGEVELRMGRLAVAEALLRQALDVAPTFRFARFHLGGVLHTLNRSGEALAELDRIESKGGDDDLLALRGAICSRIGRYDEAVAIYRDLTDRHPQHVESLISLANALKFVGDTDGAVAAYRRVLAILPEHGEAWWSLADLKTYEFADSDVAAMERALARPSLRDDDRLRIHFALGKALEDRDEDERSFAEYARGNAIRAGQLNYDPAMVTDLVKAIETTVTKGLIDKRGRQGCNVPDPIFILGMPRAGSTLVEQILASHSQIEGTAELPDIIVIARELEEADGKFSTAPWERYPAILADLPAKELKRLGQTYIDRTRAQRHTDKPRFTDKMPNNWIHVGLIRLILPAAKIVDVRRDPLACGFSNFKQHYARGQEFSYDLEHFGEYYRDYVRLMRHFDAVAPGAIHRVIYEDLIDSPEAEVTRLLEYLGLAFEPSCMRFHENKRAVRTASSGQVRRPINSQGLDQWRRFERWLEPLKQGLGPALRDWRG